MFRIDYITLLAVEKIPLLRHDSALLAKYSYSKAVMEQ